MTKTVELYIRFLFLPSLFWGTIPDRSDRAATGSRGLNRRVNEADQLKNAIAAVL